MGEDVTDRERNAESGIQKEREIEKETGI